VVVVAAAVTAAVAAAAAIAIAIVLHTVATVACGRVGLGSMVCTWGGVFCWCHGVAAGAVVAVGETG